MIYGVALLAGCMFAGSFVGNLLGILTGLNSDIGGVGFAMILLLLATNSKTVNKIMPAGYTKGVEFWKEMFIPVIIALSASQNVASAIDGGLLALLAGVGVVVVMMLMIPLLNKLIPQKAEDKVSEEVEV
ncbi:MAG: malonate transporter subunit MadL [Clostridia bacterium]|nr:malonate transporter subunit MadL [Clostridia bacterium]